MSDTIGGYSVHPTAALFPLMEGEPWREFVESIRLQGLLEPIVVDGKTILDGRNRMRACMSLQVAPKIKQWNHEGSAVDFIVSMNITRRHLDAADRALLALQLKPMFDKEAKQRMLSHLKSGTKPAVTVPSLAGKPKPHEGRAVAQAARATGVGSTTVSNLMTLTRHAPHLLERVKTKELTVEGATRLYRKERRAVDGPGAPYRSPEAERRRLENERLAKATSRARTGEYSREKLQRRIGRASRVATNIMHSLYAAVSSLEEIELYITDDDRLKIREYLSQIRRLTKLSKERLHVAKD